MSPTTHYRFAQAWLPSGWQHDVTIGVDSAGDIVTLTPNDDRADAKVVNGAAIAGMTNVHGHAFQRAMAGLAEHRSVAGAAARNDSFWTWRETMYEHASRMSPATLEAIAAQLYVEMLKAGYTSACEFHYLHNRPDGRPHDDPLAMHRAIIAAAGHAGIGLTLLPTLYQNSDFGGAPPTDRQRQFVLETDDYLALLSALHGVQPKSADVEIGIAFHSLRAVPGPAMREVLSADHQCKIFHIHVAEQEREVQSSRQHLGRTPIEWLLQHAEVDRRWCLVHATHATRAEIEAMAAAGAVVGLCPTTEANLGDGFFALETLLAADGAFAIGSDSHICISPTEELRWLEYQARLLRQQRNVLAAQREPSSGAMLWRHASEAGARAGGRANGALAPGLRADIVVLDLDTPLLCGRAGDDIIDTFVFAGPGHAVRDVMVGGRWVVQDRLHVDEAVIAGAYRAAVQEILR
ncbi:MAG TPA: formimidoylglutamate deiminase [Steroidobacteraceae bacterium]